MQMPGRNGGEDYRYAFNGMEHDPEVSGDGNSYTTEFRAYDPRLGRWKSLDPVTHHQFSPYIAFDNNPVTITDPSGADGSDKNDEKKVDGSLSAGASLKLTFTFGGNKSSFFNIGFGGSVMANGSIGSASGQLSLNVSTNYVNGGLTTPFGQRTSLRKGVGELTLYPSIIVGGGRESTLRPAVATNLLGGEATSALMNPIPFSLVYSVNRHFNTEGRTQNTATAGIRIGQFYASAEEDSKAAPWVIGTDGEDRWWTGSASLNFRLHNGGLISFGFDVYTGNSYNSGELGDTEVGGQVPFGPHKGTDWMWANQNQNDLAMGKPLGYNQSLNNALTFLRYRPLIGPTFGVSSVGPTSFEWQNGIHHFLPFHLFEPSSDKDRVQATISN
jgi:RHS repeat-associated protein